MTTVSGSVDEVLARLASEGATGALDLRAGKRRWIFYLRDGALVWTRSNLKSEQDAAVRASLGDAASDTEVAHAAAALRVAHAHEAELTEETFHDGTNAKETWDLPLGRILAEGVGQALGTDGLREELAELASAFPAATGDFAGLGFPDELTRYLGTMDGARPFDDVVAFAPSEQDQVLAAIWAAWRLGLVEAGEGPAESSATALGGDSGFPDLDIGALIADARAEAASGPEEPELTDPGVVPVAHEASLPGRGDEHPLAGHLQELSVRLSAAQNHFEVLDVPWDSPPDDFRGAYMKLAQALHPDRFTDADPAMQEQATVLFDKVRAAWEELGDDEKRGAYIDRVIHGKKTEEELAMEQIKAYWAAESEFKKGLAAFKNGRTSQAHGFFERAAQAVPDELEWVAYHAYTSFAVTRTRDPQAAEDHIERLKQVLDKNKSQERKLDMGWVLLGRSYRERNMPEPAKRCFVQALRYNPANADAQLEMRRLKGDAEQKKKGLFGGLFGRGKKK